MRLVGGVAGAPGYLPAQPRRCHRVQGAAVHGRQVIALHEVLGQALPVQRPVLGRRLDGAHLLGMIVADEPVEPVGRGVEVTRRAVEVDEQPSHPLRHGKRGQAAAGTIEAGARVDERCGQQRAVERVAPAVIGADEALRPSSSVEQPAATVTADVGQDRHAAVRPAHDDQGLAEHLERVVGAGFGHFVRSSHADPAAQEDTLDLQRQHRGVRVERRRHAQRHRRGAVTELAQRGRGVRRQGHADAFVTGAVREAR